MWMAGCNSVHSGRYFTLYYWKKEPSYRVWFEPLYTSCTLLQVLYHWVVGMSIVHRDNYTKCSYPTHVYMYSCIQYNRRRHAYTTLILIHGADTQYAHTYMCCIHCIYLLPIAPSSLPSLLFPSFPLFLPCICACVVYVTWNTFQKVSMTAQVPWYISTLCISIIQRKYYVFDDSGFFHRITDQCSWMTMNTQNEGPCCLATTSCTAWKWNVKLKLKVKTGISLCMIE